MLTNNIIEFTAGNAERQEAYKKFVEYYELYKGKNKKNYLS